MKKFTFQLIVLFTLFANWTIAQNLIAVQNGGTPAFYQQVNDAILNSQDGDTIYIPGGSWNISQPIIKRIHIFGVGHNPDSTIATFQTTLIGNVTLTSGASQGTLTGVSLTGLLAGMNETVDYYTITRCRISAGIQINHSYSNFTFTENIIEGAILPYGTGNNCSFFNNIISAGIMWNDAYANCAFKNNIFLYQSHCWGVCSSYSLRGQYSLIENNIFIGSASNFSGISNSIANNNLFVDDIYFPNGTNVGLNNITNQLQSNIFLNQSGNTFTYSQNYHLQATCPGKNAGTEGTDIGIYGGTFPWKDGSIPFNPHIQLKNSSNETEQNGKLNVNIKVAAQDR